MPTLQSGVLRLRPRVNVTRGYTGNEPGSITLSAPLNAAVTNLAEASTIYSGQPIELHTDGTFKKATVATSAAQLYIAYHDSTDTDVTSCGKLLGFSVMGTFEIETAWCSVLSLAIGSRIGVSAGANSNWFAEIGQDSSAAVSGCGYVTEIRDLGVLGHTATNARGGALGSIPEDSTAPAWHDGVSAASVGKMQIVKFVTTLADAAQ